MKVKGTGIAARARVGSLILGAVMAGSVVHMVDANKSNITYTWDTMSTAKPSGYCTKSEVGKKKWYKPATKPGYWLRCVEVKTTTRKWKKA
jgi:hypothetical protein